jgi:beta-glucuronidase
LLVRAEGMTKIIDDPLGESLDVIGFNEYIGWYEQTPEDADKTVWKTPYEKPLIVSEFGGDAKYGLHGDSDQRWTEEYQANLYRHQLLMLKGIGQLRGMSPWVLMDFRSPRRTLPGIHDYFNRKGLISDQGEKKETDSIPLTEYCRYSELRFQTGSALAFHGEELGILKERRETPEARRRP